MKIDSFKNKNILITGGTGSVGSAILEHLTKLAVNKVRIFSRDEYKQHKLRYLYQENKNIEYILGDVRDLESLQNVTQDIDIIFHCAAYKHVPISEEMPEEFIKTNILGSINVKKAAIANNVPLIVSISTDKAANPSNLMGLTKAVQEKIFTSHFVQKSSSKSRFINVRFGNVIGTAGSLFPIIYHQIMNKQPITLTDPKMTRFFMSKKEAIELIFWAALNGNDGETVIKKMKAVQISELVKEFLSVLGLNKNYQIKTIGVRVGEKIHEHLISEDELFRILEKEEYFIIKPYSVFELEENVIKKTRENGITSIDKFSSNNPANLLSKTELKKYINDFINEANKNIQII